MGVSIEQYRLAIGLFNSCRFCKMFVQVGLLICTALLQLIMFISVLLTLITNDIEVHPGPGKHNLEMCHMNIRSLTKNFTALQTSMSNSIDIIALSETFLTDNSDYHALSLDGFKKITETELTSLVVE